MTSEPNLPMHVPPLECLPLHLQTFLCLSSSGRDDSLFAAPHVLSVRSFFFALANTACCHVQVVYCFLAFLSFFLVGPTRQPRIYLDYRSQPFSGTNLYCCIKRVLAVFSAPGWGITSCIDGDKQSYFVVFLIA